MSESLSTKIFGEGLDDLTQLQQTSKNSILVKFVAPHCPSCETLAPVLQQLVTDHAGKLHLVTIDMTQDPEFDMELGVRSAPTVVLFQGTKVLERIAGLKPKKLYADAVQKVLSA
ncbi:MAG: thioredoxin domain-containing protein [Leptolyngbyaceae cyanobacterium bins.349]|nr:thioredoxin domain-containing protein [Leptolyngbyaceae cyanobacterium bins.349]